MSSFATQAAPLSFFDTYPNCCVCDKTCYPAEQLNLGDKVFHYNDECWSCGVTGTQGCGKRLERIPSLFQVQLGVPYCNICFEANFLEGYGTKANVLERPSGSSEQDLDAPPPDVQAEIGAHSSAVFRLSAPIEEDAAAAGGGGGEESDQLKLGDSTISQNRQQPAKTAPVVLNSSFSFNNACPKCNKTVYKMEEIIHSNQSWHKTCFCCGGQNADGCQRVLSHGDFTTQAGVAYCNACFAKLFKQGAAAGSVASVAPRGGDAASLSAKFANLGGGGANDKCPACSKTVYKMEAHSFEGATWHKSCFTCGGGASELGCKRVLAHGDYKAQAGLAFCNGCFTRHFMKAGARGAVLITANGAIETRGVGSGSKDESDVPPSS